MSISNRSVNVKASTSDLEAQLESYQTSYGKLVHMPEHLVDDAQLEWLESGIELIEAELDRRDDADSDPAVQGARQAEQDADEGIEMGSYGS